MKRTRSTMMQAPSLHPQLEFEVIKLVLLREKYLIRLKRNLDESEGNINLGIIGLFDTLRDVSMSAVESIHNWEQSQVNYPLIQPFMWNGLNYLSKMIEDISFLTAYPQVAFWLEFPSDSNPFFIPPELLLFGREVPLVDDNFIVFGQRPEVIRQKRRIGIKDNLKSLKSPYNTRIINDTDIFPSASVEHKLNAIMKGQSAKSKTKGKKIRKENDKKDNMNVFETFIAVAMIKRMRDCWDILCRVNSDLINRLDGTNNYFPEKSGQYDLINFPIQESPVQLHDPTSRQSDIDLNSTANTDIGGSQFHKSIRNSAIIAQFSNESLRLNQLSPATNLLDTDESGNPTAMVNQSRLLNESVPGKRFKNNTLTSTVRLWTPHEVNMKTLIERRGGESTFVIY
jgi:hypothetical protein